MGRKEERLGQTLEVKIPSFFRCPISLDVMRSPVSLCTGVTYDRASIQKWLDSGNTTCPATMLPLPSTDLVPNLTLGRLIQLWCSSAAAGEAPVTVATDAEPIVSRHLGGDLLRKLRSQGHGDGDGDLVPKLRELSEFFASGEIDEFDKNNLLNAGGCATVIASLLRRKGAKLEVIEATARVLSVVLTSERIEDRNKKTAVADLSSDLDGSVSALLRILKEGSTLQSRIDAARVLESIIAGGAANREAKVWIAEKDDLIEELVRLIKQPSDDKTETMNRQAVETALGCLSGISAVKRIRPRMVRAGVVPALARVLTAPAPASPAHERALRVMEAAAGCAEGRAAICEDGGAAARAVAGRMMKAGREGAEAAVVVLWSMCHLFRDRRAVEAVATAEGAATKLLLLMQSGCSPVARQMAGDLLKIFRPVNGKCGIAGYESKTTHIMPF